MAQQMKAQELRSYLFIMILVASLIMFAGSVYMVKQVAELYGSGAGAVLQSRADGTNVISLIQPVSSNLGLFHIGAVMSYVLSLIAIVLFGSSLLMVVKRADEDASFALTYGLLNSTFLAIYTIIMLTLLSYFQIYLSSSYIFVIWGGIALGAVANGYLQYELRVKPSAHLMSSSVSIDPSTPFSNMINLQDEIFSKMSGHLRVIDKHFNTAALTNLSRLIDGYTGGLNRITVITSREMQDSKFSLNAQEFEREMQGKGVPTEVRIMDPKDSADQHERLLMDDSVAYKIPPFSIINRKSEHITKVKSAEARARFHLLYARAQKI
jgi:uncharacterized membrane protein YhaH (DUF805 family)